MAELLNESHPQSDHPSSVKIALKPHQLAALQRMTDFEQKNLENLETNVGIYGDIPGYGKTMTVLSLICKDKESGYSNIGQMSSKIRSYTNSDYGIIQKIPNLEDTTEHDMKTTLICVPKNMINHWYSQIRDYTNLSVLVVHNDKAYNLAFNPPNKNDNDIKNNITNHDILLCSNNNVYLKRIWRLFHSTQNMYSIWRRFIIDEADSVNIPNMPHIHSKFVWFVTATYSNLRNVNNNGFIKQFFGRYYSIPHDMRDLILVKGSNEFVKKSFEIPDTVTTVIECLEPSYLRSVRGYLDSRIVDMINSNDTEAAVEALGGTVGSDDNVISLISRSIDNKIIALESKIDATTRMNIYVAEKNKKLEKYNEQTEKLKATKNRMIENIKNAVDGSDTCFICLVKPIEKPTLMRCCCNLACGQCILTWKTDNPNCPYCRSALSASELCTIGGNEVDTTDEPESPSSEIGPMQHKPQTLAAIVKKYPEKRFLIFSGRDYYSFWSELLNNNIDTGSRDRINDNINKFRKGTLNVLLLNARNYGAGVDLHEATDVIFVQKLSEDLEKQAIGRAQRPGRTSQLKIWKLYHNNEL